MPPSSFVSPSSRTRTSSHTSQPGSRRSPLSTFSELGPDIPEGTEEWDGVSSTFLNAQQPGKRRRKTKKKRDEPMKPITVILYVVFFYVIWQILTRSTEIEILSHLSPSSPHHLQFSANLPESSSSLNSNPYHLPYQFPHLPSQLPAASSSSPSGTSSPSTTRWILGYIFYPFYLLLIPLALLMNIIHVLISILATILVPFTSTGRMLAQLFIWTPYSWARTVGAAVYPIYVFVGGMIGVGCVMGLGTGWIAKKGVEYVVGVVSSDKKKTKVSSIDRSRVSPVGKDERDQIDERGFRSTRHSDLAYRSQHSSGNHTSNRRGGRQRQESYSSSSESDSPLPLNPRTPTRSRKDYVGNVPSLYPQDSVSRRGGGDKGKGRMMGFTDEVVGMGRGSSREGVVVGTRRRGVRYEDD